MHSFYNNDLVFVCMFDLSVLRGLGGMGVEIRGQPLVSLFTFYSNVL